MLTVDSTHAPIEGKGNTGKGKRKQIKEAVFQSIMGVWFVDLVKEQIC